MEPFKEMNNRLEVLISKEDKAIAEYNSLAEFAKSRGLHDVSSKLYSIAHDEEQHADMLRKRITRI